MLLTSLAVGVLVGTATVAVIYGLRPPPARLDRRIGIVLSTSATGLDGPAWQTWRDRLVAHTPTDVLPDLALLGRDPNQWVAVRLAWTLAGLAAGAVASVLFPLPAWTAPLLALGGAAAGWSLALHEIRDAAAKRRRTLGLALAAWTQMSAMLFEAGLGIEESLTSAARVGNHWTFDLLNDAITRGRARNQTMAATLTELGDDTDVVELRQIAGELRLTDRMGGTPKDALLARARTMREEELAAQLAAAKTAEVKTAIPLVVLAMCLTAFVLYPAVETFLGV